MSIFTNHSFDDQRLYKSMFKFLCLSESEKI
jgi:hypothetical protein